LRALAYTLATSSSSRAPVRSARRPDGSQVYLLSVVRHRDAITVATRPYRREDE
jgi:hypothetical protein